MNSVLKNWVSGSLRRRRTLKHFGRHPLQDVLAGRGSRPATPEAISGDLLLAARGDPAAAIALLQSHADGLTAREAEARLVRSGPN